MPNHTKGKNFYKNKSKILHTVIKMFLSQGYHKTTLRDISKESGIAYSSLVNIFGSKEGLLVELVAFVLEWQFSETRKLISEITDDKVLFYAVETVLQLHIAEMHEHMREMYAVSYSLPESSKIIYKTIAAKLEGLLSEHLPTYKSGDFYCLEIAAAGIMRSFITVPCDMFFTMEVKIKFFLEATLRVLKIPEKKIAEAIEFVGKFDFYKIAQRVSDGFNDYLTDKT